MGTCSPATPLEIPGLRRSCAGRATSDDRRRRTNDGKGVLFFVTGNPLPFFIRVPLGDNPGNSASSGAKFCDSLEADDIGSNSGPDGLVIGGIDGLRTEFCRSAASWQEIRRTISAAEGVPTSISRCSPSRLWLPRRRIHSAKGRN